MSNIKKILSNNIKKLRISLGLTQEQFAELIKVQPRTIPNIESGRNIPKAETVERICKVCNVALFELFLENNKKQEKNVKIQKINNILQNSDDATLDLILDISNVIRKRNL